MGIVVVVGSLNMDLIMTAERWPKAGETVIGKEFMQLPGGKGANQAVAAAAAGAAVKMIGRVGKDTFGPLLRENLIAHGVDASAVIEDAEENTGIALVGVDAAGENRIVVIAGANGRLSPADVEAAAADGVWSGARVCLLQLETPLETVIAAARAARRENALVILDPAPAVPLPAELLELVDLCLPNSHELATLTNRSVENVVEARLAASALLTQGVGSVVVKLGADGALLVDGNHFQHFPAHAVEVVDTTGAGDAFAGSVAAALAENKPLEAAIAMGNLAGALACTRKGAQSAVPLRSEIDRLLKQA